MTTPLDDGHDPEGPDGHRTRRALESYPEFFAYPGKTETGNQPSIPAARAEPRPAAQMPDRIPDRMPSRHEVSAPTMAQQQPGAEPTAESALPPAFRPSAAAQDRPVADRAPRAETAAPRSHRSASSPTGSAPRSHRSGSAPSPTAPSPTASSPTAPAPRSHRSAASPTVSSPTASARRSHRSGSASSPTTSSPTASSPTAPTPPRGPGRGRRRAKRSFAASLWPFHAFRPRSTTGAGTTRIRYRSTSETVWRKLKADRAAVIGGCVVVLLILMAVCAPLLAGLFGVDPDKPHPELTDATFGPHGFFGGMSWAHPLGVDQRMGRDVLARLLFGSRVSLLIAFGATLLGVGLGAGLGVVSGYLGGRVDAVVMRTADVFLAFPLMLFALGLTGALSDEAFGLSGNALRIAIMIFVMGFFSWPYLARIVRAEVLSLREREFVDAARALGAGPRWILWRELMPNLMAPILVYATLLIPANIIFEAGLSALGIGLDPPAASWGQMMTDAVDTVYTDPAYLIVPGMAVFITVLAFNLFGDGLRDALDPTAQ
ncbi:MAG: ABC transporter permease subunit [Catenulispora sp.]